MKKNLPFVTLLFFLLSITNGCSKTHTGQRCTAWVGEYAYNEDPVPTATGINRIMEWELSVFEQHDTCWGTLEITGLRTYIKVLTMLSGDSSKVDVVYNKYLDGSQEFRQGDVLFSLSKDSNRIMTTWNVLQPQLRDYSGEEGLCFRLRKKKADDF